ncbi:MAG: hypothetical protein FJ087_08035 [Deltaproteobacteria bacterium]|nr:hypothetical protein [Deltaproteobacteria bacterium]
MTGERIRQLVKAGALTGRRVPGPGRGGIAIEVLRSSATALLHRRRSRGTGRAPAGVPPLEAFAALGLAPHVGWRMLRNGCTLQAIRLGGASS